MSTSDLVVSSSIFLDPWPYLTMCMHVFVPLYTEPPGKWLFTAWVDLPVAGVVLGGGWVWPEVTVLHVLDCLASKRGNCQC